MARKIEREGVVQDLAMVRKLLSRRSPEADPIGYAQFSDRARELEGVLAGMEQTSANRAKLTVFFAGEPVDGSRGIKADFAGRAVDLFQELISKQFANLESGLMAGTGPVPFRGSSDMLLTGIARGSVGLVLEEAERNESLTASELSVAVSKVSEDIQRTAEPDPARFEELLGDVDHRYFGALVSLFRLLDEAKTSIRLVDNQSEVRLDAPAIRRGRERIDAAIMQDDDSLRVEGRLFVLPKTRKFELRIAAGETISGGVSPEFAQRELERLLATTDVVNRDWAVRLKKRTITRPNRDPLFRYTLLGLIAPVGDEPV